MKSFNEWKREYQNTNDKIDTDLYRHIKEHGANMSCVKIYNRNNVRDEVSRYSEKLGFKGTTSGVVFTLDGTDYALLDPEYDSLSEHITLHIIGDNIKHVCDVMVDNGDFF